MSSSNKKKKDTEASPSRIPPPPLPPPPKLHATTERLPTLSSAPPSANLPTATLVDLPPPPRMSGINTVPALSSVTPNMASRPPPNMMPPPPPESLSLREPPPVMPLSTSFEEEEIKEVTLPSPPHETVPPVSATDDELHEPSRVPLTPTNSLLARRQSHIPILVIATEAANRLAWKNNLRLVDMLEGLSRDLSSVVGNMPLPPFRSVHRSMLLHWDTLQVTFCEPSDYRECESLEFLHDACLPQEGVVDHQLENQVEKLVKDSTENENLNLMDLQQCRQEEVYQVTKEAVSLTSPPDSPWFVRYRTALDESTNYLPHELLQSPPLVLLVCTSSEPLECLRELSSPHFLPREFHNGQFDKSSLREEALVLHDVVDGGDLDDVALKQSMVQQFGAGAAILKINSVLPETASGITAEEDLWNGGGTRGKCLSVHDRLVIRRYLASMITTSLLPALERRISDLNFIVTDRKKGVKNVFKSLWRKPKEDTPQIPPQQQQQAQIQQDSSINYRFDSIESQVRLLADTLFLMRDWDASLNMYRLIREDYKSDRAMMEYASVNEMMALAAYHLDSYSRGREAFSYLENALFSYSKVAEEDQPSSSGRPSQGSHATRLATRICLVLSAAQKMTEDRPLEVADLLASASSHETPLGAAVLLEQSATHYFRAEMGRKFAFHMLMSGHMFRSASQEYHALRCFTSSLCLYHTGKWDELHNHLRSALAAQLYSLGRMSVSVELYAKLVGTDSGGKVSQKSQQKFLQHLMEICNEHTEQAMTGSDRMADEDLEERQERLALILSQPNASRILELHSMNLPAVLDESVTVEVESKDVPQDVASFGIVGEGEESVWQELKCHAEAELAAVSGSVDTEQGSPTLAKIQDPLVRSVISAIDKTKTSENVLRKAKRSGNYKEQPAVRARMEPLSVNFVLHNPLSVEIDVEELQLVARMTEFSSQRVCTTEDAIVIGPEQEETKTWTFTSSSQQYQVPRFCRISDEDAWKSASEDQPFFVVTKMDATLEEKSSVNISLGICPLVVGDLEILGVRCRLFDDIWVYHPFHVKGPLLQNSSYNRANRVRAESMLLKAKVEQDMPRLCASLVPKHEIEGEGPVLVGQVTSWTLRLSNIGTAPASNLSLKTNVPWVSVDTELNETSAQESLTMPHCVGPSGTLLNLPLTDIRLKTPNVLEPGETVDIGILIRTSGGGKQPFYMLYRYELWNSPSKRRWLQYMLQVPVSPSLTLTASLMPSFWKQNEHVLSVEMTNYRSDRATELEVRLDKLSLFSRHYQMELLDDQLGADDAEASSFLLGWQERITLHYRVTPLENSNQVCYLSECRFKGGGETKVKDCTASAATSYLCMEHAQHDFQHAIKAHQIELARAAAAEEDGGHPRHVAQIRRAKSNLSGVSSFTDQDGDLSSDLASAHPTSIARLCPPDSSKAKLNMVCTWSAVGGGTRTDVVHGQHNFTRLSVRPKTTSRGCPITITCKHPSHVSHDFANGSLNVPFEITLRNRLIDADVNFEFSVERPQAFEFIGAECFQWSLHGGEELIIPMQAVIPKEGVYNLQSVRLKVDKADEKVPYLFPLQWMVRVN